MSIMSARRVSTSTQQKIEQPYRPGRAAADRIIDPTSHDDQSDVACLDLGGEVERASGSEPHTGLVEFRGVGGKSQTKSQRPSARGIIQPHSATVIAARCPVQLQRATFSDRKDTPYKREATGSNPVAPTSLRRSTDCEGSLSLVAGTNREPREGFCTWSAPGDSS